jgi:heme-degrading monooxygenase HmoA
MHATIRRYRIRAGSMDEIVRRVQSEFVPLIRRIPGFVSYHVLDAGNDIVMSVSVYERKEGAEEGNQRAAEWVKANLAPSIEGPVHVTVAEVKVTATAPAAAAAGRT